MEEAKLYQGIELQDKIKRLTLGIERINEAVNRDKSNYDILINRTPLFQGTSSIPLKINDIPTIELFGKAMINILESERETLQIKFNEL